MSPDIPDATHRWRCAACGNLTRFDVTRTRRTAEYWHVGLDGDPAVETTELLAEDVESVVCRWCARADAVEVVARVDREAVTDRDAGADR